MPEAEIYELVEKIWSDEHFVWQLHQTARFVLDPDPDSAEAMVQEAGVALVHQLRRGETIENPRAWLRTVVANNARQLIRRCGRRRVVPLPLDGLGRHGSSPEQILVVREILKVITQHLPPRPRICLSLHILGYSDAEIAESLEIKEGSVVRNIERARARLRLYHIAPDQFPLTPHPEGGKA
jgi:RNA polymerase sigma factor (sigma-70 family)